MTCASKISDLDYIDYKNINKSASGIVPNDLSNKDYTELIIKELNSFFDHPPFVLEEIGIARLATKINQAIKESKE